MFLYRFVDVSVLYALEFVSSFLAEHGYTHGHSHGGFSRSRTRLTQLVATDDNENDETFRPPVPPAPSSLLNSDRKKDGRCQQSHSHNSNPAAQMNMRGVFLHVLADALGSVIVIASASVRMSCVCFL
jgi:zinc transporter 1